MGEGCVVPHFKKNVISECLEEAIKPFRYVTYENFNKNKFTMELYMRAQCPPECAVVQYPLLVAGEYDLGER